MNEANQEVQAEVVKPAGKKDWFKDKDARMTRVFRIVKPQITRGKQLVTFMSTDTMVNNQVVRGKTIMIAPNHANQYVLSEGADKYEDQLKAIRGFEESGEIVEVDPRSHGVPFVSDEEKRLAVIEKERSDLRKSLGME